MRYALCQPGTKKYVVYVPLGPCYETDKMPPFEIVISSLPSARKCMKETKAYYHLYRIHRREVEKNGRIRFDYQEVRN